MRSSMSGGIPILARVVPTKLGVRGLVWNSSNVHGSRLMLPSATGISSLAPAGILHGSDESSTLASPRPEDAPPQEIAHACRASGPAPLRAPGSEVLVPRATHGSAPCTGAAGILHSSAGVFASGRDVELDAPDAGFGGRAAFPSLQEILLDTAPSVFSGEARFVPRHGGPNHGRRGRRSRRGGPRASPCRFSLRAVEGVDEGWVARVEPDGRRGHGPLCLSFHCHRVVRPRFQ